MTNPSVARKNMVDSQIHTFGVVSAPVLEAFRSIPREEYVPESLRGLVYSDTPLPLGEGRFMMEPAVLARMVENASVTKDDKVLNFGDPTGYSTAILSTLARRVVLPEAIAEGEQFSLIFMNGAIAETPEPLLALLAPEGRMITIIRPAGEPMGTVTLIERVGEGVYATRKIFDATTPYIPGFEPQQGFRF